MKCWTFVVVSLPNTMYKFYALYITYQKYVHISKFLLFSFSAYEPNSTNQALKFLLLVKPYLFPTHIHVLKTFKPLWTHGIHAKHSKSCQNLTGNIAKWSHDEFFNYPIVFLSWLLNSPIHRGKWKEKCFPEPGFHYS